MGKGRYAAPREASGFMTNRGCTHLNSMALRGVKAHRALHRKAPRSENPAEAGTFKQALNRTQLLPRMNRL